MSDLDEDFIPEDDLSRLGADEAGEEEGPLLIKKLREKLKKAVEEKQVYLEGWQRARADFVNFKKEEAAGHSEKENRIKAEFFESLIPALDSLDMALKHSHSKELARRDDGLELVHKQLQGSLKELGVGVFGAIGEVFDPYTFEALQEVPTNEEQKDHTVESLHRMGYKIGEKIIRPAQVSVYVHDANNTNGTNNTNV